jgi:hypothetical protein
MLAFDAAALLDRFEMEAFVSAINSGDARRKTAIRWFFTGPGSSRDGQRANARDRRPNSWFAAACRRQRPI